MSNTVVLDREEYDSMIETLKSYREIIDTYEAVKIAETEKRNGSIKKLSSLKSLIS